VATLDLRQSTIFSRLRGLLEVTRLVRTGEELPELLAAIARTVSDSLGFRTVVINLYRREWDDFVVSTVYGSDEAREALLGQVRQVVDWEPLLDQRFLQRGAYLVPNGEFDWSEHEAFTPDIPAPDDPNAWHPEDALFAPMRAADGSLLGILSVDEPISGRKPSGDEIDVLVAVSEHAAIAVEAAQEAARAKANREALEQLLEVSTHLNETADTNELLHRVCSAISEALGFDKVAVQLLDTADGLHRTVASVGFADGENHGSALEADQLERLLDPEWDIAGCVLLPHDEARRLLPERPAGYRSRLDGRGPHAWQNHWLFVPLHDRRGRRIGYIWADDPVDRLRPDAERLKILRAFANQAATALDQASQFEEIQNANEHHRALIDASPLAIVDFDVDGRIRSWNSAAAEIFGWSADDVVGRFSPLVPEDDREPFLARLRRVGEGDQIRDIDVRRLHRDGTLIDVSTNAGPIRNGRGEIVGVVSLMQDVTARKRAERALVASEARKDAVLRAALDGVVIVDHEGIVTEMNPASEEIFGWTRADTLGRAFLELAVAPEHRAELEEVLRQGDGPLLGSRVEVAGLRADHRSFPAEVAITRVDVPGPLLFAVSIRDITKRVDRETRMREAEAKYRTLVEQLPLATYINDLGMPVRTRYVSPQIESMLGFPVSDWLEPGFLRTRIHPDDLDRVMAEVERTHGSGESFRMEYRLIAADGRVIWVLDETVAVRDDEYRPLFLQGFLLDVTDRHAVSEALQRSEELHRLVVESSRDLITLLDADGVVRYASPAVETLLGWTPGEVVGRNWTDDSSPEDVAAVRAYMHNRAAGIDTPPLASRVRTKSGEWVTLEAQLSPTLGPDGSLTGFVGVSRPVRRETSARGALKNAAS
jgi:PAS domain S-box-containing protein